MIFIENLSTHFRHTHIKHLLVPNGTICCAVFRILFIYSKRCLKWTSPRCVESFMDANRISLRIRFQKQYGVECKFDSDKMSRWNPKWMSKAKKIFAIKQIVKAIHLFLISLNDFNSSFILKQKKNFKWIFAPLNQNRLFLAFCFISFLVLIFISVMIKWKTIFKCFKNFFM